MPKDNRITQPTIQEIEQLSRLQQQQQQTAIQMQLSAEMRAVAHEVYLHLLKKEIDGHEISEITQARLRDLAKIAAKFSPYVLECELPQFIKVNNWPDTPEAKQ